MKIAICDDNKVILDGLMAGIRDLAPEKNEIQCFSSGDMLLRAYKAGKVGFDVIFLDIEMEGMDGIETANAIRSLDRHVLIVFVTSHERHARRCFECRPFRFLLKPVSEEELRKTYMNIYQCLEEEKKTFIFTEDRGTVRLFCEDIIYFESKSHWVYLHTKETVYKIFMSMTNLSKKLDLSVFCRVHKSYIVNLAHLWRMKGNEIILYDCEESIPISRSYKKALLTAFTSYQERKYVV